MDYHRLHVIVHRFFTSSHAERKHLEVLLAEEVTVVLAEARDGE